MLIGFCKFAFTVHVFHWLFFPVSVIGYVLLPDSGLVCGISYVISQIIMMDGARFLRGNIHLDRLLKDVEMIMLKVVDIMLSDC